MSGNITFISLHERVEQEHVNYEQYLNRCNINIQVRPGLLLLDLREKTIHERIVIYEPLEPLDPAISRAFLKSALVNDIVLTFKGNAARV